MRLPKVDKPRNFIQHGQDGGEGIRTPDPMVANHVLCQLSYTPDPISDSERWGSEPNPRPPIHNRNGGPGWIRTTDLTLIRGAL
jgi:hypothetical protein